MKFWKNSVIATLFVFSFVSCKQIAQKAQETQLINEVEQASNELQEELQKQIDEKGYIDPNAPADLTKMQDTLSKAASTMTGQDAIAMELSKSFLSSCNTLAQKINTASINIEKGTDYSSVESLSDLNKLTELISDYRKINAEVKDSFVNKLIPNLKKEATSKGLKGESFKEYFIGIESSFSKQIPHIKTIRDTDDQVCEIINQQHKLLKENWGKWQWVDSEGYIEFEDDPTMEAYNKLALEIDKAVEQQTAAQQALISNM